MCVICCTDEDFENENTSTTLECGHTFHTECIINWFRIGNSNCPICRNDPNPKQVTKSPWGRYYEIKRKRKNVPSNILNKFKRVESWEEKEKEAKEEIKKMKKVYAPMFKKYRNLQYRAAQCRAKQTNIKYQIGRMPCEGVSILAYDSEEE